MLQLQEVSFRYAGANHGTESLSQINLDIKAGECILLTGPSGCGKTTLTRILNGLCPQFYEGEMTGRYLLDGKNANELSLSQIGVKIGSVFQDPRSQFFCTNSTDEVMFSMESRAYPQPDMERRLEALCDILPVQGLLNQDIFTLSSGEKQKIAIASVCATAPQVLVLDEPSANLDSDTIEQLSQLLARLKERGHTIIVSEHRLYYMARLFDRMLVMENGCIQNEYTQWQAAEKAPGFWSAQGLRGLVPPKLEISRSPIDNPKTNAFAEAEKLLSVKGGKEILRDLDFQIYPGEIVALIGSNGAGKTTFCRALTGASKESGGIVRYNGAITKAKKRIPYAFFVQQDADYQLYAETVYKELLIGLPQDPATIKRTEYYLRELGLSPFRDRHPGSLSGGQKQRVLLAAAALRPGRLLVLDEPTSGLDGQNMIKTAALLKELAGAGSSIMVITHDMELVERCATRICYVDHGKIAYSDQLKQGKKYELEKGRSLPE